MTYDNRNDDQPLDISDALLSAVKAATHHQLEYWHSDRYDDLLLEVLTSLHRDDEAERLALMRETPSEKYHAMIKIYWVKLAQNRVVPSDLQTLETLIDLIENPAERTFAPQMIPEPHDLPENGEDLRETKLPNDRPADPHEIAVEMAQRGNVTGALTFARNIEDSSEKSTALALTAQWMTKQGSGDEALTIVREIEVEPQGRASLLSRIASIMARGGEVFKAMSVFDEALSIARGIEVVRDRAKALRHIVIHMMTCRVYPEAFTTLTEALTLERLEENRFYETRALGEIVKLLCERGDILTALAIAHAMEKYSAKPAALTAVASTLAKQGKSPEAAQLMDQALAIAREIQDESLNEYALVEIAVELAHQGKTSEALTIAESTYEAFYRGSSLHRIAKLLAERGEITEALRIARMCRDKGFALETLSDIGLILEKQGRCDEASDLWEEALSIQEEMGEPDGGTLDSYKVGVMSHLAKALVKRSDTDGALAIVPKVQPEHYQVYTLAHIATTLAQIGNADEAWNAARKVRYREHRRWAFENVAAALAKQERYREALEAYPRDNPSDFLRFIIGWRESLPAELFNRVLKTVLLILSSEMPQWQRIHDIVSAG